jgi:hypothetical protein
MGHLDLLVGDNASVDSRAGVAVECTPQARPIENPTNQGLSSAEKPQIADGSSLSVREDRR